MYTSVQKFDFFLKYINTFSKDTLTLTKSNGKDL